MIDWKGVLIGLVPFLAGLGITASAAGTLYTSWTESREASAWPTVTGRITSRSIESTSVAGNKGARHRMYRTHVNYAYDVNGVRYRNDRVSLGQEQSSTSQREAEEQLREYPLFAPVTVHYDPARPQRSALIIESAGSGVYIGLGFGLLVLSFGAWFLWNSLVPRRTPRSEEEVLRAGPSIGPV